MTNQVVSEQILRLASLSQPFFTFMTQSRFAECKDQPGIADFVFGNPHEMPLAEFVEVLKRHVEPQNQEWYAYKINEPEPREAVAAALRRKRGRPFEAEDIFLTNGAFAAINVALTATLDPGDEVIYVSPPWFFYELLITKCGGKPVRVQCRPDNFDLDLDAIREAITPRTRGVLVNSPHNPTGRIYPPETLETLASMLHHASRRVGRTVYLFSDEAYSQIVYDGRPYPSPTAFYPNSFLLYTYGKTLLTPGQRAGYLALPPEMDPGQRELLRQVMMVSQVANGFAFPNALLQYSLGEMENLSISIPALQARRDRLVEALGGMGYELHKPEGTFYLLVRSPIGDDVVFCDFLADESVFVLPGAVFELPGYFRISLTANDTMIDMALPVFERAMHRFRAVQATSASQAG